MEAEGSEGGLREARRRARRKRAEAARRRPTVQESEPIVAKKPGNAGGAKGCRKMETRCRANGRDRR